VQVQAQVNDVRFAAGTSMVAKKHKDAAAANAAADALTELRKDHGSYNWFLRIRFELAAAHEHCTVVSKFILMYPPDLMSTQDLLNRYNVGNSSKAYSWTIEMDVPGGLSTLLPGCTLIVHGMLVMCYYVVSILCIRSSRLNASLEEMVAIQSLGFGKNYSQRTKKSCVPTTTWSTRTQSTYPISTWVTVCHLPLTT
jgi:hypothetical protein